MTTKLNRKKYFVGKKKLKKVKLFEEFINEYGTKGTGKAGAAESLSEAKYWMGTVHKQDDFGDEITDEFIDGKTNQGPWGFMTQKSWDEHGVGKLGTGYGQRYKKQENGKWMKIEG